MFCRAVRLIEPDPDWIDPKAEPVSPDSKVMLPATACAAIPPLADRSEPVPIEISLPARRAIAPDAVCIELDSFKTMLPVPAETVWLTKLYPASNVTAHAAASKICDPAPRTISRPACSLTSPPATPVLALKSQSVPASRVMSWVACRVIREKFLFRKAVSTFKKRVPEPLL